MEKKIEQPTIKPNIVMATQRDIEEVSSVLGSFAHELRERVEELKENNKDVCIIKDECSGLFCELHSKKYDVVKLKNLGLSILDNLRSKRGNIKPTGMG